MKPAEECVSLAEVREAIDTLDRELLALLGRRAAYVHAAARFKTGAASVRAPGRVRAMLEQRRAWAADEGLDPDVVAQLFTLLAEMRDLDALGPGQVALLGLPWDAHSSFLRGPALAPRQIRAALYSGAMNLCPGCER